MFPTERGLSHDEVKKRQQQYGANVLPETPPPGAVSLVISQLASPMVYILLIAAVVTVFVGNITDAGIILIAVLLNTVLGFLQERRASKALYALKRYVTHTATVIRDSKRAVVHVTGLVPGDVVVVQQGAKIPADGTLLFANRMFVDEAILTGESMPVKKETNDSVSMGTTIISGQGMLRVQSIGATTKIGAIAGEIQEVREDTPLERQMKIFSKQLVLVVGVLVALVFVAGLIHGFNLLDLFVTSVALAVSSIPEGLLVSLTVVLAIGMQRILRRRGLVRTLTAAETLGGVSVICVDKTGTLTQGTMTMTDCVGDEKAIATQAILANDLDDPIVIAAFEWARGKVKNALSSTYTRLDSIPFSSKDRFFISLHRWSKTTNRIFVNGAPEVILAWTTLAAREKEEVLRTIETLTSQGNRIIGFARKDVSTKKTHLEPDDARGGLTWVGMLAFTDPVRPGVKEALSEAQDAGIRTIVITGDYPSTSQFVLAQLGLPPNAGEIMTGDTLAALSDSALAKKVTSIRLFARTTPDQKLRIVDALKKNGEVVAMMGDGVNDAPAIHKADIGVVVGDASDVARESADLVLLDSNFATIMAAVEEGRAIFENIRKIVLYLMCDAFVEIFVVLGSIILGLPLPVSAAQILWINLISDGFPNLALTVDPPRRGIMREKPRSAREKLVTKWVAVLIGFVSTVAGIMAMTFFIIVYRRSGDLVLARSVAFVTMGLNSLAYVFSVRLLMKPFWKNRLFENRLLILAVVGGFALQVVPFAAAPLRRFFGLTNLGWPYWALTAGLSVCIFLFVEIFKFVYRRYRHI